MYLDSTTDLSKPFIWAQFGLMQLSEAGRARDLQIAQSCARDGEIEARQNNRAAKRDTQSWKKSPKQNSMSFPTPVHPKCHLLMAAQLATSQPSEPHRKDARGLGCNLQNKHFLISRVMHRFVDHCPLRSVHRIWGSWKFQAGEIIRAH